MEESAAVLAVLVRGGVVESVHRGQVVVTDQHGVVMGSVGDVAREIYPRSALKPFQAAASLNTPIRAGLAISTKSWAIACAPDGVAFERDEHFPGQRGSFTTRLFRFRAIDAGAGLLRLAIGRPGMAEPLGQVDLHLTVFA